MVLQQPQHNTSGKNVAHLRIMKNRLQDAERSRYMHFGALLRSLRDRVGYTVEQLIEKIAPIFQEAQVPELGVKTYGNLERDERYPHYQELWPLFRGLVEGCNIELTAQDGQDFYDLARQKISASKKWHRPEADWQALEQHISEYTTAHQEDALPKAMRETESTERVKEEERQRILRQLDQDTSHILGRDNWLERMFSYLEQKTTARKKIIVIQAAVGAGKTSCMKLLQKRVLEDAEDAHVIHHECKRSVNLEPSPKEKTPIEHLDVLLAHILNDLQPQQAERYEAPSTMERIRLVLQAIREVTTRLVILIDDAQVLLEQDGELYSGWQHFLNEVIEHNHQVTLFIATREWPGWTERKDSYLIQTDLETLSPETCIQVWKQLGYVDEQEDVLRQAAAICEYNPRMMEIVAQNVEKPLYSFGWSNWRGTMKINEQQGLARFVEDPHYLSNAMLDAYPLLDEIITTRLSPDTRQLLTILAVAPVPLPAPLLTYLTEHPKRCIKELIRTSLLARDPDRLRLLPLVAESTLQQLSQHERASIEERLITAYQHWMREGSYRDEQEQAVVITELTILHLKHLQLLEAAELVIGYGWLSFQFGYASRVTRIVQQVMENYDSKHLTPQQDIAAQLLHCRLAKHRGEKLTTKQRGHIYQQLYTRAEEEHIILSPAIEIYLMKPIVISLADNAQFENAQALVNGQLSHIKSLQENDSATYESYLYYHAYLLAKWGEYKEDLAQDQQDPEEVSKNLRQAREHFEGAASLYKQCADLLRRSLRGAAPIERSSISYKLARRLNDYAHYARRSKGKFEDIEDALQKSIDLKRQGYTLPISLPVSHAEYAQFLASTGQYQRASEQSDLALQQMEQLVQEGYSSAKRELAVLQIERAELHLLLGNLEEAQQLFELSKDYVQKSVRRKQFVRKVEEGMQTIEQIRATLPGGLLRGQLDYRWISRYKEIADYDTFWWLEPSGPFTDDEQYEWSRLSTQSEQGQANDDLKLLLKTALHRELDEAVKEQRNPHLIYPVIPIDLVRQKASESLKLRNDIENEEPNSIVKSLYLGALDEHLALLHLIEACYLGDSQAFSLYNDRLNPAPTAQEMEIATQELVRILKRGMAFEQTAPLSQKIFRTLQNLLLISPYRDIAKEYSAEEHKQNLPDSQQENEVSSALEPSEENPLLSIDAVKAFFDSAFSMYGFDDWSVRLDPSTLNARVEQNTHELILPKKPMRLDKILHLLAHEIECHIYRSANGERSKLSLLGYGTANYLPTEEAFATLYSAQAERKKGETPWIGTLAVGLASGSRSLLGGKIRPQNFYELYSIMRDYHQLNLMLNGKDAETAKRTAHRLALSRCVRTWRGVPSPLLLGTCFTKDNCYLRGYLLLQQELEHAQRNGIDLIERLQVGAIGVEHVQACEQLGIVKPIVAHKRLAFDPQIRQYIVSFQRKAQASNSTTFSPLGIENE